MIDPQQLQLISEFIDTQPLSEQVISALRLQYPQIHFTYCMEDDIPNQEPVLSTPAFNLYLVDGREHCLCLTRQYEHATGVVIAEVIAD